MVRWHAKARLCYHMKPRRVYQLRVRITHIASCAVRRTARLGTRGPRQQPSPGHEVFPMAHSVVLASICPQGVRCARIRAPPPPPPRATHTAPHCARSVAQLVSCSACSAGSPHYVDGAQRQHPEVPRFGGQGLLGAEDQASLAAAHSTGARGGTDAGACASAHLVEPQAQGGLARDRYDASLVCGSANTTAQC